MILFDLEVVLEFAGQMRLLGDEIDEVVRQSEGLRKRVTDTCAGGFVEVFEEKIEALQTSGQVLAQQCENAGSSLHSSGYRIEDIVSQVWDYSGLSSLAVHVETGGLRRVGNIIDSVVRIFSRRKVQADVDVLREVARSLRSVPDEVRLGLARCECTYENYECRGGQLVPLHGAENLFASTRSWIDDFEALARWLEQKANDFEQTQQEALTAPTVGYLTGIHTEYIDPWGHGDEAGKRAYKEDERPLWLQILGVPHTWDIRQWSDAELFDAITIVYPLAWAVKPLKGSIIGLKNAPRILKNTDNINNLKHVDDVEIKKLPAKEEALKNATRKAEDNLDEVLKIDGAKISNKGYFAEKGSRTNKREWYSEDPDATAKEVFEKLSEGGCEYQSNNPGRFSERTVGMSDGRTITYRYDSASKGPTVEINGDKGATYQIPIQKIHFYPKP